MKTTAVSLASVVLLAVNALSAQAFHVQSGTACETVGASCTYYSDDSDAGGKANTLVTSTCGPDNFCASNGASCGSDDACYNYCGTDGVCGGAGAGCNSQDAEDVTSIVCQSPWTCSESASVGSCILKLAASGSPEKRRVKARRLPPSYHRNQARSSDIRLSLMNKH